MRAQTVHSTILSQSREPGSSVCGGKGWKKQGQAIASINPMQLNPKGLITNHMVHHIGCCLCCWVVILSSQLFHFQSTSRRKLSVDRSVYINPITGLLVFLTTSLSPVPRKPRAPVANHILLYTSILCCTTGAWDQLLVKDSGYYKLTTMKKSKITFLWCNFLLSNTHTNSTEF